MVLGLPFVAFVLLQRDRSCSLLVVPTVVLVVVALVGVMEWIVLTPLWSRWLGTIFSYFGTDPNAESFVPSRARFFNFRWEAWGMFD
jgi:uncharacterized membrane protein YwaF